MLAHMPPTAHAARLAGDAVMAYGAWRRRPGLMAAGLAPVALGAANALRRGQAANNRELTCP